MDSAHVPLPVASLCRRARNARSAAERHLAAYHAWEGSIRLAVAATPPPAATDLSAPSIGTWVSFCRPREALLAEAGLLAAYRLFSAEGLGKRTQAPSVSGRRLLDALPAYRNAVIGHGGSRDESFYAEAGAALLDGIEDAWRADLFWPADARLLLVDAVALDARGGRRARLVEICGMASLVRGDGEPVPDGARPGRLYLEAGGALRPLHPWVIYQPQAPGRAERVLFFDKLRRGPEYLDYTSGDVVKGKPLADAFPGLDADCLELSRERPAAAVGAADESGPATVGDYRILGKLGEGGMGVVYLARQESLGRLVTVKMLPAEAARDETAMARFQREVNALARADHPNIVKILSCGRALGTAYYAMELIEGADLCGSSVRSPRGRRTSRAPSPPPRATSVARRRSCSRTSRTSCTGMRPSPEAPIGSRCSRGSCATRRWGSTTCTSAGSCIATSSRRTSW